jgi:hypothetical protein
MMKVTKSILDGTRPNKRRKTRTGRDEMEAAKEKAMIVQVPRMRRSLMQVPRMLLCGE